MRPIAPEITDLEVGIRRRIGGRIRAQRSARGMTARRLAAEVGVGESAVSQWENGTTSPRPLMQLRIAETLDAPWAELFNPEDIGEEAA